MVCSSEYSMENLEGRSGEGFRVNSIWTSQSAPWRHECRRPCCTLCTGSVSAKPRQGVAKNNNKHLQPHSNFGRGTKRSTLPPLFPSVSMNPPRTGFCTHNAASYTHTHRLLFFLKIRWTREVSAFFSLYCLVWMQSKNVQKERGTKKKLFFFTA